MGSKKDLTSQKKQQILTLLRHTSKSQREIAKIAGVSRGTVFKINKNTGNKEILTSNRIGKCGRKRITDSRDERKIIQICINNCREPLKILAEEVQTAGINISGRTLQRRLLERGFKARKAAKKPLLTSTMVKKRIQWARDHRNWTENDWAKVRNDTFLSFEI